MPTTMLIENPLPAFAYVAFQEFKNLYPTDKALRSGTIFKELDIPFEKYRDNPIMNPFKD